MPRRRFTTRPEGVALSLEELCQHDDVCTDILVDRTRFHTNVRKCKVKYAPLRGIDENLVLGMIHETIVLHQNPSKALGQFLGFKPVAQYHSKLDTVAEKQRFSAHGRAYLDMYLPECPWEVSSTNRYTVCSYEAAVVARSAIAPGVIPFLVGTTVDLTDTEDHDIAGESRGFSVMVSAKTKTACMMLGPARFVNHDCDANASIRSVDHGVEIVATRTIRADEEITVRYGGDYFGPNNVDCLCATCELLSRNGWRPSGPVTQPTSAAATYHDEARVPREYRAIRRWLSEQSRRYAVGRFPADYVLTKSLLVQQYDRWARCRVDRCGVNFVQRDGYQLRSQCPRCERHRAIYGLPWPTTQKDDDVEPATTDPSQGDERGGRCGKGRWVSEEVESAGWTPHLRATALYVPTAEAKRLTRQGRRIEADTARARGITVDVKFAGGESLVRRSRRLG